MYKATLSSPQHYMEAIGKLHTMGKKKLFVPTIYGAEWAPKPF
jgi:hypothetical protein